MHATHLTDGDVAAARRGRARYACFCPTTERDLGDGIGPSRRLHEAGSPLTLGSDSHAVIDLFEEMRAVELDERLATQQRGHWSADELLRAATVDGHRSLGLRRRRPDRGRRPRRPGHRRHRLACAPPAPGPTRRPPCSRRPAPTWCTWSATASMVTPDRGAGRGASSTAAIERALGMTMTSVAAHRHRRALHPGPVDDRSAARRRAGRRGRPGRLGRPVAQAPAADAAYDVGGRAVIPGFVDSHATCVFAGDRAEEFAARMTGTPYSAGGIRTTVAATRAATDEQLAANLARLVAEMRRQGTTTRRGEERLRAHGPRRGAQRWRSPGRSPTRPRSSARTWCRRSTPTTPPAYVDLVTGPMLDACAPHARWVDVFCERGAFDADQARAVLPAGAGDGLRGAAARQPARARARACGWPASSGWPRSTTAPTSPTTTSPRSPPPARSRPCCPAWSSRPARRTRTPAGCSTPACTVALASDCNPGSCYTSSMPLCIALAVREMGHVARPRRSSPRPRAAPGRWAATTSATSASGACGGPVGAGRAVVPPPRLPARGAAGAPGLAPRPPARLTAIGGSGAACRLTRTDPVARGGGPGRRR